VPYLKKDDYSTGIYEANLRIIQRIAQAEGVKLSGMPTPQQPPARRQSSPTPAALRCCGFLILMFLLMAIFGAEVDAG
jgi:uncharacterized membrane protein YgcG